MKKFLFITAFLVILFGLVIVSNKTAQAFVYYGAGGRAWYPTRSFTGNYYGSGGLWGNYHGGNLYGPGNYGTWWWKSGISGRWWYGR